MGATLLVRLPAALRFCLSDLVFMVFVLVGDKQNIDLEREENVVLKRSFSKAHRGKPANNILIASLMVGCEKITSRKFV